MITALLQKAGRLAGRVKAAFVRAHAGIQKGHRAGIAAAGAAVVALATFSLYASTNAASPTRPDFSAGSGVLSEARLQRMYAGLSPHAMTLSERIAAGKQGWTPTGLEGWGIYDLSDTPVLVRRQLSFEEARVLNGLLRPADLPILPMKAFAVKDGTEDYARALDCMSQAIYYEAANESTEGQQAVAQVVLNRVQHPAYPNTVCGVVYQGSQRVTGCQFSFTCDGSLGRAPMASSWDRARRVAVAALQGDVYKPVGTATHYHADYVLPYWAVTLVKLRQIGAHIFYRMTGPNGTPDAFDSRYAGRESSIDVNVLYGGDGRTPDAPTVMLTEAEPAVEAPRMVTLMTGGEARTYMIGAAGGPLASAGSPKSLPPEAAMELNGNAPPAAVGMINPSRRLPTADEIRQVNERLRALQIQQDAIPLTPGAPPGV